MSNIAKGNFVEVTGNLTRDPELRYTPSGAAVAKFGIAVNDGYKNRTTDEWVDRSYFFNVNAWRQLAENVAESLGVGDRVVVVGKLVSRSWETEDGGKRTVVEIEADEVSASLGSATVAITKVRRGGPGDWATETADMEEAPA